MGVRRGDILKMQQGASPSDTSFNRGCKGWAGVKKTRRKAWSSQGKGEAKQTTLGLSPDASLACRLPK